MPNPASPTKAAPSPLVRFNELRLQACQLLMEAARLPSLPALHVAQAEASAAIAGIRLHRIHGQGGSDDALAIRADLEVIARKLDPLIAAIGDVAMEEFHNVDPANFTNVVSNSLSDNAIPHLAALAERIAEERAEELHDARHPGSHAAGYAREA